MMQLAAALAQEGATDAAGAVAQHAGGILEHAGIFPLVPFLSFLLILGFGKQLKFKGAELGIAALAVCFVLSLGAGWQWMHHVDDAGHATEATEALVRTGGSPGSAPGESAGGSATATTVAGDEHGSEGNSSGENEATTTSEGGEAAGGEEHVAVAPVEKLWTWWQSGDLTFDVGILVDGLSVMMLFVVSMISLLVHVYSTDYVHGDVRYTHFFAFLSLFTAAMLMLVISATT